jgi:hypothetical protein
MAEYSYSIRATVDKELPPVSSNDYTVDFCSVGTSNQTPPRLNVSLSAFGTASVSAVLAECFTCGTTEVTFLAPDEFSTASNHYIYLRDSSNHTASSLEISCSNAPTTTQVSFCNLGPTEAALFPADSANSYVLKSLTTVTTGSIQVLVIGG